MISVSKRGVVLKIQKSKVSSNTVLEKEMHALDRPQLTFIFQGLYFRPDFLKAPEILQSLKWVNIMVLSWGACFELSR